MYRLKVNESGFTLIEMLIVILIISILLLIAVPNMAKNSHVVKEKSCEATIQLVQSQVAAYEVEKGELPADFTVMSEYIDRWQCPDGEELQLENGEVVRPSETVQTN